MCFNLPQYTLCYKIFSYMLLLFTAIQDTIYYQYALNGNGRQFPSKNFVVDGAWFTYNNNRGHEKLSSKGPLHSKVNVMVWLCDNIVKQTIKDL